MRVDKNSAASVPIINLILNGIAESQYIIVDISETNANVFYELGVTPVSYTHLDVYKRQEFRVSEVINHMPAFHVIVVIAICTPHCAANDDIHVLNLIFDTNTHDFCHSSRFFLKMCIRDRYLIHEYFVFGYLIS